MNLLITGAWQQAKEYINILENDGHKVQFIQFEQDELPCDYSWVEGVIGNGIFMSHKIDKFVNLKYIQLTSAGLDRVPMEYIIKHGIKINNARGVYSIPMAEYAVAGVLNIYKCQHFFGINQKNHIWEKRRDLLELNGKNVCILGCGSVGVECAKRFVAFGCNVFGVDIAVKEHKDFLFIYPIFKIKEIVSKSDIVIITMPLTDKTYHIFDAEMFKFVKQWAIIINISRGALVDTEALVDALQKKLAGAVLDVFEEEPLSKDSLLWELDNVIITPHNSFVGDGNNQRMSSVIMNNLRSLK